MQIITRRLGQAVTLGDEITVTVREVGTETCKLSVEAPPEVNVRRGELPSVRELAEKHGIDLSKAEDQQYQIDVLTGKRMVEE